MKLNTNKYKLSLFTESVCPDCQDLKQKLTNLRIPYYNKCITSKDDYGNIIKENIDNRWEFKDADTDNPGKIKFTPVMIIEDTSGHKEYYSAGGAFETNDEAIEILKKYCI